MQYRNYSEQDFINAVKTSKSRRQILNKLGLATAGGNYQTVNKLIKKLGLDISHFEAGHDFNKGRKFGPKRTIEEYLNNKFTITSHTLRLRLIEEGIFEKKCSHCNLDTWNSKPIPLELDHINGDHNDNSLENLRILCPNCHAQTENYRGKNKKKNSITEA